MAFPGNIGRIIALKPDAGWLKDRHTWYTLVVSADNPHLSVCIFSDDHKTRCAKHTFPENFIYNCSKGPWIIGGSSSYAQSVGAYYEHVYLFESAFNILDNKFLHSLKLFGNRHLVWPGRGLLLDNSSHEYQASIPRSSRNRLLHTYWCQPQSDWPPVEIKTASELLDEALDLTLEGGEVDRGLDVLKEAARLGSAEAHWHIALLLIKEERSSNRDMIARRLFASAAGGFHLARMALGFRHRFALDFFPRDEDIALLYYITEAHKAVFENSKLTQNNHLPENIRLDDADALEAWDGGLSDNEQLQYLQFSATRGNVQAQVNLAQLHYFGYQGVERNMNVAAQHFEAAAAQGNLDAEFNLGVMALKGQGPKGQNKSTFYNHMKKAAAGNHTGALNGLAVYHMNDLNDTETALKYFFRAAAEGSRDANFNLGSMYSEGKLLEQNDSEAFKFYSKAARSDHLFAQERVAELLMTGKGTLRNNSLALKKAASLSVRGFSVGNEMNRGLKEYTGQNFERAGHTFSSLAEAGYEPGAFNKALLGEEIGDADNPETQNNLLRYLHLAAKAGNPLALVKAGHILWQMGQRKEAIEMYKDADNQGVPEGTWNLGFLTEHQYIGKISAQGALDEAEIIYSRCNLQLPCQLSLFKLRLVKLLRSCQEWIYGLM